MSRENKGLSALRRWLVGAENTAAPEPVKNEAPKEKTYLEERAEKYATTKEELKASDDALVEWKARAAEALKAYNPKHGAYRIRQEPAGHYVIEKRFVRMAYSNAFSDQLYYMPSFGLPRSERKAEEIASHPVTPIEVFEAIKNPDAPIQTKHHSGYGSYLREEWHLSGYQPMIFNVFEDAEAYLQRMVNGDKGSVEYDFPPLKRRLARKVKAKPQE